MIKEAEYGAEPYRIHIWAVTCGDDLSLTITGGTKAHIGAVALAIYEPARDSATVSNLTVYSHRDDVLAAKCAKRAAIRRKGTATAAVGIHIDAASPEDLVILQENCMACLEEVL